MKTKSELIVNYLQQSGYLGNEIYQLLKKKVLRFSKSGQYLQLLSVGSLIKKIRTSNNHK
ncbi:hypothetical protein ES708_34956 [subsurface metagenome]